MSFLSIAFLAALPLVAAPLLLHLFDRRRNVVIEWAAMQFLMDDATQQTRPRRIQHWLLLVLRMAALAALVLALARPMVPVTWPGDHGRGERIIVIDNSMSMMRDSGGAPLIEKLVQRAQRLVDDAAAGETVRVLVASPYPMWLHAERVSSGAGTRGDLRARLRQLRPTLAESDLLGALLKAVHWDWDGQSQYRKIVMLTDGQASDWETQDTTAWSRFRDALADAPLPTTVEVVHVDQDLRQPVNLAVNAVRARRAVVGVHQPFTLAAEVQNFSALASKGCAVQWLVEGELQDQGRLPPLDAGAAYESAWTHSIGRTGVYRITCRLDATDDLPSDDAESVVVQVVQQVPVLLVEDAAELAEIQRDAYLVQAALGRSEGHEGQDWQAVFNPHTVAAEQLDSIPLDDFRAVVVPNLTQLSPQAVERLADFVTSGGGLWLALGPRTDVAGFHRYLFNGGDGLSPVALDGIVDTADAGDAELTVNPFLKPHPATLQLADHQRLDTGDIGVVSRFRLRMPDGFSAIHVPVLLDLSNGEPLAVEKQLGQGRVIVQGIPLRLQWSDLAVSQAFVVMVHDWLSYLTEPGMTRHNLRPGDPLAIQIPAGQDLHATLTLPDGRDVPIVGQQEADGVAFRTSHTILPGPYQLELGTAGERIAFQVARDAAESDLRTLTSDQRQTLAQAAGLDGSVAAGQVASGRGRRQYASPMWSALLILLIVLIAVELWLSGSIARRRFGIEAIAETAGQIAPDPWSPAANVSAPANRHLPPRPPFDPRPTPPTPPTPPAETIQRTTESPV